MPDMKQFLKIQGTLVIIYLRDLVEEAERLIT